MYINKKKFTIGCLILICLIAVSLIFVYTTSNSNNTSNGMVYDSDAKEKQLMEKMLPCATRSSKQTIQ